MEKLKTKHLLPALFCLLAVGYFVVVGVANASKWDNVSNTGGILPPDSSVFAVKSSETAVASMLIVASSGPVTVYGVHLSSGLTSANYVVFFDTGAVGGFAAQTSTKTAVNGSAGATNDGRIVQFNPPLRFLQGLTTRATSCTNSLVGWCYTVLYDTK